MRIQRWILPLVGLLAWNLSGEARGQGQPGPFSDSSQYLSAAESQAPPIYPASYAPPQGGAVPMSYSDAVHGGGYGPGYGGPAKMPGPGGYPFGPSAGNPEFQPYPKISPFDKPFEQHFVEDGLWKRRVVEDPRYQYFFTLEGIVAQMRRTTRIRVGNRRAATILFRPDAQLDPGEFEALNSGGIRARWGFVEPDQSGFELNGFWVSKRGDFLPQQPEPTLDVAFDAGPTVPPVLFSFDRQVRFAVEGQAMGAGAQWFFTPFYRADSMGLKLRPLAGIRYLHVREDFQFQGTTLAGGVGGLVIIDSLTRSHMAGPELGLRYDFGGEFLYISGRTSFVLFGTQEHLRVTQSEGFGPLSNSDGHGHLSPALATELAANLQVFHMVPLIKRMSIFENAVLRLGISYILVGEVARPADIIPYQALPAPPGIRSSRTEWDMFTWDIGVHWRF